MLLNSSDFIICPSLFFHNYARRLWMYGTFKKVKLVYRSHEFAIHFIRKNGDFSTWNKLIKPQRESLL